MNFFDQVESATEFIRKQWPEQPTAGLVLGTGSGQIADALQVEQVIDYGDIPNFPRSTALGHSGKLVCGRLLNEPVVAMQGRFHLYEGYTFEQVTLPIHTLARLGIGKLLVSNAAGGINPRMKSGEIMLITSHLDLMYRSSPTLFSDDLSAPRRSVRPDQAYDQGLIQAAEAVARRENFVVHRGVYAGLLGPNYETRAEYRMVKRIGGDVAGMSTVPEVTVIRNYPVRVLAASIISNVAKPDVLEPTSGQEVIDAAEIAAPHLAKIFAAAIQAS